jgi:hypothetical protein
VLYISLLVKNIDILIHAYPQTEKKKKKRKRKKEELQTYYFAMFGFNPGLWQQH